MSGRVSAGGGEGAGQWAPRTQQTVKTRQFFLLPSSLFSRDQKIQMRVYGRCTEDDENDTKLIIFTYIVNALQSLYFPLLYSIYSVQASELPIVAKVMVGTGYLF